VRAESRRSRVRRAEGSGGRGSSRGLKSGRTFTAGRRETRRADTGDRARGEALPPACFLARARFSARKRIKRNTLRCTSGSSAEVDIGCILTHLRRISRVRGLLWSPRPSSLFPLPLSLFHVRFTLTSDYDYDDYTSWFCGTLCSLFSFLSTGRSRFLFLVPSNDYRKALRAYRATHMREIFSRTNISCGRRM